ncbi:MAG: hypothetical protein LQ344_007566 [Seirophora lacunosa]|nr:MAG: hypothetical protein LQ344_007566 [Seirophora lacunosa]
MGNCSSTPSALCCKKRRRHHWPSSPFTWPAIPGRQRIKCTTPSALHCIPLAADESSNGGGGSPRALQRSNAVRRPPVSSRSHSRTPSPHPGPGTLRVRNTTPPPPRPTSIVPTLLLTTTPSTNQTSSLSHRCSTAPTSPTTVIGSVHHHAVVCGDADHRPPATLYMVDGEVLGSGGEGDDTSPRYELRWIDALRAPGAGGYRTVVDVVEERRSGRLTVVNGRASLEDQDEGEDESGGSPGLQQQQQRQFQRVPEMTAQLRPRASVGQEMGRQHRWDFVPRGTLVSSAQQ